jgi:hypothetical protein
MILASFCGEQLLTAKNKDGLKAMEVAESLRNFSCANTLQVCERNIMYQNAMIFRDQQEGKTPRQSHRASARGDVSPRVYPGEQEMPRRNPNVKTFAEDLSNENEYDSEVDSDAYGDQEGPYQHLDYQRHIKKAYTQRNRERRAMMHEHEYRQKTERDRKHEMR